MKQLLSWIGIGVTGFALGAGVVGCNGLLGINSASLEGEDSGTPPTLDAGTDGALAISCDTYCALMDKNCNWSSSNGEYFDLPACLQMCAVFDQGGQIAPDGTDSLGCRMSYALQAAQAPEPNCRFAGLTGGGKCGKDLCSHFCQVDIARCNTAPVNTPAYDAGASECASQCAGYTYLGVDSGAELNGMESGNTLNCRIWHLNNAMGVTSKGVFHCPHTAQVSMTCQ